METTESIPPATVTPAAWWEDFIDIYMSPREVFTRRRDGRFVAALIFLTLMMALLYYASLGPLAAVYEAEFARGIAQAQQSGQQIDPEMVTEMRGAVAGIMGTVGMLFSFPLGILLTGLVIWIMGRFLDSKGTFELALVVATYAQFPKLIQMTVGILQGFALEPTALNQIAVGPSRFLDSNTTSQLSLGLLGRFDVFFIWTAILIAIGMQVTGRMPATRAYIGAFLVWLIAAVPTVIAAIVSGG